MAKTTLDVTFIVDRVAMRVLPEALAMRTSEVIDGMQDFGSEEEREAFRALTVPLAREVGERARDKFLTDNPIDKG